MRSQHVVKRFGLRPTRGFIALFILAVALMVGAFWIGPLRPRSPDLKLVALSGDGRFREYVGIPSEWADTLSPASEATARFPLILAAHNAGARVAQPTSLALSVPSRYRITDARGVPFASSTTTGNPLVRYELPVHATDIEPMQPPTMIAGTDTIWLEAVVPAMYCTAMADSVPEFISAPAQNEDLNARVRIFYSFTGGTRQRQTGLLTVQVDPNLVKRTPAPMPPVFPTQVFKPAAPRPQFEQLEQVGDRFTSCGDPGQPMDLHSALWETPEGGRFFVLYHGGVPRKYLFDLDRDSIIELEMWDKNADGKFESRRAARMAIPAFLMPFPTAAEDSAALADSAAMRLDSAANTPEWQQLFYDVNAGPLRFSGVRRTPAAADSSPVTAPVPASADTLRRAAPTVPAAPAVKPADPEFVNLFNNSAAGPLRFYRAARGEKIPPPPPPRPRVTRPSGPKLLGVPVDSIRR
jgi:hypothetical protein